MAKEFDTHDSFDEEPDTIPSRLDELTMHRRLEERERIRAGWRRNLLVLALLVAVAVVAKMASS